ncbi:hypothetical protein CLAIMM_08006 [Cladophialophora immunda]|nr:hypothetical protein CLAIMM_08006 [Cladophialophora immunda]
MLSTIFLSFLVVAPAIHAGDGARRHDGLPAHGLGRLLHAPAKRDHAQGTAVKLLSRQSSPPLTTDPDCTLYDGYFYVTARNYTWQLQCSNTYDGVILAQTTDTTDLGSCIEECVNYNRQNGAGACLAVTFNGAYATADTVCTQFSEVTSVGIASEEGGVENSALLILGPDGEIFATPEPEPSFSGEPTQPPTVDPVPTSTTASSGVITTTSTLLLTSNSQTVSTSYVIFTTTTTSTEHDPFILDNGPGYICEQPSNYKRTTSSTSGAFTFDAGQTTLTTVVPFTQYRLQIIEVCAATPTPCSQSTSTATSTVGHLVAISLSATMAFSFLFSLTLTILTAFLRLVSADSSSACNPLNGPCPAIAGLTTGEYFMDFTQQTTTPPDWILADYATVGYGSPNGANFTFAKRYDAPYIWTRFYVLFGRIEVVVQAAPGAGIITSSVMMSDDLDEIDWEWSGNNFAGSSGAVQTNYFGKGQVGNSDRGSQPVVDDPEHKFHTYALDWQPDKLVWSIDGVAVRTLKNNGATTGSYQYPQTPSRLHLGLWCSGDPSTPYGTVYWGGGYTNFSAAPFSAKPGSQLGSIVGWSGARCTWRKLSNIDHSIDVVNREFYFRDFFHHGIFFSRICYFQSQHFDECLVGLHVPIKLICNIIVHDDLSIPEFVFFEHGSFIICATKLFFSKWISKLINASLSSIVSTATDGGSSTTTSPAPSQATNSYTVVAGDYGWAIANSLGCSLDDLNAANPGVDWDNLQVGQTLNVPAQATGSSTSTYPSGSSSAVASDSMNGSQSPSSTSTAASDSSSAATSGRQFSIDFDRLDFANNRFWFLESILHSFYYDGHSGDDPDRVVEHLSLGFIYVAIIHGFHHRQCCGHPFQYCVKREYIHFGLRNSGLHKRHNVQWGRRHGLAQSRCLSISLYRPNDINDEPIHILSGEFELDGRESNHDASAITVIII